MFLIADFWFERDMKMSSEISEQMKMTLLRLHAWFRGMDPAQLFGPLLNAVLRMPPMELP